MSLVLIALLLVACNPAAQTHGGDLRSWILLTLVQTSARRAGIGKLDLELPMGLTRRFVGGGEHGLGAGWKS